jgi:adiponectin receptor
MMGAILCLMFSTIYHLFSGYGQAAQSFLSRLDYSGIAILIAGSTFPPVLYGFACSYLAKIAYIVITTVICLAVFVITLLPEADSPPFRKLRGTLFIVAGLFAGVPLIQAICSLDPSITLSTYYWVIGGVLYIMGASFYIARMPERLAPGRFDIFVNVL